MFRCKWFFGGALILALFLSGPRAQAGRDESKWEPEIKAFEASDRTNPPPQHAVLFLGSSSIRFWKTLAKDFAGWPVINRGFGGSEIADSTALADRIVFPYHPSVIVFYAGDNDIAAGESADGVVADYKEFVRTVHARLPETKIVYIAIKPCPLRWKSRDKIASANRQIAAMRDPELSFVDVYTAMLNEDGKPRQGLYKADGLHPSQRCYELWTRLIKPYLGPPERPRS